MIKNNKTCLMCGCKYTYCSSCKPYSDINRYPRFMVAFHDKNCFELFNIIGEYKEKYIDKNEAKARLAKITIPKRELLKDSTNKVLDELLAEPTSKPKAESKTRLRKAELVAEKEIDTKEEKE